MNRYWIYLKNEVAGPFEVDRLIRQRGFAREARVCLEQPDGRTGEWMSASEIPELARIFRAADEMSKSDPAPTPPKPPPKPAPAAPKAPVIAKTPPKKPFPWVLTMIGVLVMGASVAAFIHFQKKTDHSRQNVIARDMVENANFPSDSLYRTVRHYLDQMKIRPRWEIERVTEGVSKVTLSWFDEKAATRSHVYAFETNQQALTVRPLNTAAEKWLAEGPVPRVKTEPPPPPPPKKPSSEELFKSAIETRRVAIENADYAVVWNMFTHRKQSEMIQAGMSEAGFVQLQSLRNKVDAGSNQEILKTSRVSANERLVLLREKHPKREEIFLKQKWLLEDGDWRLDEEDKKAVSTSAAEPAEEPSTSPTPAATPPVPVQSLPGISN